MISNPLHSGSAGTIACHASLAALVTCLLRETDCVRTEGDVLHVTLGPACLAIALNQPPLLGQVTIEACRIAGSARSLSWAAALDLLLDGMRVHWPVSGPQLARRIRASATRIETIVADRLSRCVPSPDFLTAEQALIFGHWMHPCPKALAGMSLPEERCMTPDWRGALRLNALSVREDLIEGNEIAIAETLPGFGLDPSPGRRLLPVHPLAWNRLRHRSDIVALLQDGTICDLGPMGPGWWATSSVRTLWRPDASWQVKASLPVTITNSMRVNKRHELMAGALMAARMARLPSFGPMRLVGDPHWLTLRLPDMTESGFELILRDNPWRGPRGGRVMQVAGLCAPPLPGQLSLLVQAMAGLNPEAWFRAYLDCALLPLVRLYDATGIGLEAHQQNALLDLSAGLPVRCDYRDNQGFYVARDQSDAAMRDIPQLVYPRPEVEDALTYTLLVNQVFGVIQRLSLDNLLPQAQALTLLARHLQDLVFTLPGPGAALVKGWLTAPDLPAKGNMLTQLGGLDELSIPGERAPQVRVPNPLPAACTVPARSFVDVA